MNERIFDMARQSGATDEQGGRSQEAFCFTKSELSAFAELIVQECMTLMNNERDYYSKPGSYEPESYYIRCAAKEDAFDEAAILIKHHFGVEE